MLVETIGQVGFFFFLLYVFIIFLCFLNIFFLIVLIIVRLFLMIVVRFTDYVLRPTLDI